MLDYVAEYHSCAVDVCGIRYGERLISASPHSGLILNYTLASAHYFKELDTIEDILTLINTQRYGTTDKIRRLGVQRELSGYLTAKPYLPGKPRSQQAYKLNIAIQTVTNARIPRNMNCRRVLRTPG
jgi:hypothetical protein